MSAASCPPFFCMCVRLFSFRISVLVRWRVQQKEGKINKAQTLMRRQRGGSGDRGVEGPLVEGVGGAAERVTAARQARCAEVGARE